MALTISKSPPKIYFISINFVTLFSVILRNPGSSWRTIISEELYDDFINEQLRRRIEFHQFMVEYYLFIMWWVTEVAELNGKIIISILGYYQILFFETFLSQYVHCWWERLLTLFYAIKIWDNKAEWKSLKLPSMGLPPQGLCDFKWDH